MLVVQTAPHVLKATAVTPPGVSLTVYLAPILLMTVLWRVMGTSTALMEEMLEELLDNAPALPAMKDLMAQTALPVQKATVLMIQLASVSVMQPLILLMTGLLKIKETSTASMKGQSVGLQNLAPAPSVALGLKALTARLLLSVKQL